MDVVGGVDFFVPYRNGVGRFLLPMSGTARYGKNSLQLTVDSISGHIRSIVCGTVERFCFESVKKVHPVGVFRGGGIIALEWDGQVRIKVGFVNNPTLRLFRVVGMIPKNSRGGVSSKLDRDKTGFAVSTRGLRNDCSSEAERLQYFSLCVFF